MQNAGEGSRSVRFANRPKLRAAAVIFAFWAIAGVFIMAQPDGFWTGLPVLVIGVVFCVLTVRSGKVFVDETSVTSRGIVMVKHFQLAEIARADTETIRSSRMGPCEWLVLQMQSGATERCTFDAAGNPGAPSAMRLAADYINERIARSTGAS
jgi:hypothetical protein